MEKSFSFSKSVSHIATRSWTVLRYILYKVRVFSQFYFYLIFCDNFVGLGFLIPYYISFIRELFVVAHRFIFLFGKPVSFPSTCITEIIYWFLFKFMGFDTRFSANHNYWIISSDFKASSFPFKLFENYACKWGGVER